MPRIATNKWSIKQD